LANKGCPHPFAAWVYDDPDPGLNGIHRWTGTAFEWALPLPYDWVFAIDSGAGTANAIQIASRVPISENMIVMFQVFESATSSPITISVNGGAPLTAKTNRGNNASGLTAGMDVWFRVRGTEARMLNDQDVSALVGQAESALAGAEAAADRAEAAAAALPALAANTMLVDNAAGNARQTKTFDLVRSLLSVPPVVETLANAKLIDPTAERAFILHDGIRDGLFLWASANQSARVVHNTITTTSVNASTDLCTLTDHGFQTGHGVYSDTAADGLSVGVTYYVIRVSPSSFKLATSLANAFAGAAIDLTAATNLTLKRLSDPFGAVFIIPTGKALDGSQGAFIRDGKELSTRIFGAKADYGVSAPTTTTLFRLVSHCRQLGGVRVHRFDPGTALPVEGSDPAIWRPAEQDSRHHHSLRELQSGWVLFCPRLQVRAVQSERAASLLYQLAVAFLRDSEQQPARNLWEGRLFRPLQYL